MIISITDDNNHTQNYKVSYDIARHAFNGGDIAVIIGEYDPSIPTFQRIEVRKV